MPMPMAKAPKKFKVPKLRPKEFVGCQVCDQTPIIRESGMCGPCTFGTADAIGEGEFIEIGHE